MKQFFTITIFCLCGFKSFSQQPKTIFEVFGVKDLKSSIDGKNNTRRSDISPPTVSVREYDNKETNGDEKRKEIFKNSLQNIATHQTKIIYKSTEIKVAQFDDIGSKYLTKKDNEYTLYDTKGKVLLKSNFKTVEKETSDNNGFNTYNTLNKSKYYNVNGELIFDEKFEYVGNFQNYYLIKIDNKWGIADKKGKVILTPQFNVRSYAFDFNGQTWFTAEDNDTHKRFFLSPDGKTKLLINNDGGGIPTTIQNRYWVVGQYVYDMQENKRLFCMLEEYNLEDKEKGIFKIRKNNGDGNIDFYFDVTGKIVKEYLKKIEKLTNKSTLVCLYPGIDSAIITDKNKQGSHARYGIMGTDGKWIVKPIYTYLYKADENTLFYRSKCTIGLMNNIGKVILSECSGISILRVSENKFLCIDKNENYIFEPISGKKISVSKDYIEMQEIDNGNYKRKVALLKNETRVLLDSNYIPINLPKFKNILLNNDNIYTLLLPNDDDNNYYNYFRLYYTKDLAPITFNINGIKYDTLQNLERLDNGYWSITTKQGVNYIQTDKESFLENKYVNVRYDSVQKWFVGYDNKTSLKGTFDKNGTVIIPFVCNILSNYDQRTKTIEFSIGFENKQQLDTAGNVLFNFKYDRVEPILFDKFIVQLNGMRGIVDKNDKEIVPFKYKYIDISYGQIIAYSYYFSPKIEYYSLKLLDY